MLYLFWLTHIICGALTDSRMWSNKEEDAEWVAEYTDFFWLGWQALIPFVVAYLVISGVDVLSWKSLFIAGGMSVFWDLVYTKLEFKDYWVRALPLWLIIPNPFSKADTWYGRRIEIGFTLKQMYWFNGFRIAILIGTFFI